MSANCFVNSIQQTNEDEFPHARPSRAQPNKLRAKKIVYPLPVACQWAGARQLGARKTSPLLHLYV